MSRKFNIARDEAMMPRGRLDRRDVMLNREMNLAR